MRVGFPRVVVAATAVRASSRAWAVSTACARRPISGACLPHLKPFTQEVEGTARAAALTASMRDMHRSSAASAGRGVSAAGRPASMLASRGSNCNNNNSSSSSNSQQHRRHGTSSFRVPSSTTDMMPHRPQPSPAAHEDSQQSHHSPFSRRRSRRQNPNHRRRDRSLNVDAVQDHREVQQLGGRRQNSPVCEMFHPFPLLTSSQHPRHMLATRSPRRLF
jgi:hypothetical protein